MRRYYVDCVGGCKDVTGTQNGSVVVNSERVRGDIEGCDGTADVKLEDTEFVEAKCQK